jgi:hypothetical protein
MKKSTYKQQVHPWDSQGTSYPPCKDKMYDGYVLQKGKEDMAGAGGKAPAAKNLKKTGPRNTITAFPRATHVSLNLL